MTAELATNPSPIRLVLNPPVIGMRGCKEGVGRGLGPTAGPAQTGRLTARMAKPTSVRGLSAAAGLQRPATNDA